MVPPSSNRISRVPSYLSTIFITSLFIYGAITLFCWPFQVIRLNVWFLIIRLFPFRSPLLGKSRLISFPLGTEMFQFPRFASPHLFIQCGMTESLLPGSPIQISSDQCSLPAPRGFSQAATSFFASYCQGIHPVRLISWPYNPKSFLLSQRSRVSTQKYSKLHVHFLQSWTWVTLSVLRFITTKLLKNSLYPSEYKTQIYLQP